MSDDSELDDILKLAEDIDHELWGDEGSKDINARGRVVPLISAFATVVRHRALEQAARIAEEATTDGVRDEKFRIAQTLRTLAGEQ